MTHTTVFIILDAARSDYVRPDSMPFLHGLSRQSITGLVESPLGFAQRTVLFSGRYPDTSGNFSAFVYDPDNSPFKWVEKLGPLRGAIRPYKALFPTRLAVERITKKVSGAYHADPAWIPPRFLPFFRPCEDMRPIHEPGALGATSIFDLCREHGLRYRYLAHPVSGNDDEVHEMLVRDLRQGERYDLYVAQFSVTDQKGHTKGPFSRAMQQGYLPDLDGKLASIHAALEAGYDSWDLFLVGDHGMGPVERRVNVLSALKKADAEPGTDYIVFVNSTLAVLWYLTEKGREAVEAVLPAIPGSQLMSLEDRKRLRLPIDRRWGDRMLAAKPGVLYWPDYFHVRDSKIVGMHGYLDKSGESYGAAILASSRPLGPVGDVGHRPLADVFPTLCDLLGVPVPSTNEGRSLVANPTARPDGKDAEPPIWQRA